MIRKLLAVLLACSMVFAMTACGGGDASSTDAAGTETPSTNDADAGNDGGDSNDGDSGSTSGEGVKVGFVVKSLADQYWILVKAGAEATAAELGVELIFNAPNSESDVQAQVDMIQNMIGQGVDVLCVAPSSQDAVLPVLQQAANDGIKVLTIDTDADFAEKLSFIGTGNYAAAYLGGEYVVEALGEGKNAIVLRGRLGDATHDEREQGWVEALEAGGYTILEIQAADSEAEKALNITQNLMTKYDNIDVIVTTADSMAQGAQRAVEATGSDIQVMGFDGTIPVCEMTAEGLFLGTVAQNPYNMGVLGIQEAVRAAAGETIDARIDTGATIVHQANAEDFVQDLTEKAESAS